MSTRPMAASASTTASAISRWLAGSSRKAGRPTVGVNPATGSIR